MEKDISYQTLEAKINSELDIIDLLERKESEEINKSGMGEMTTIADLAIAYAKVSSLYSQIAVKKAKNNIATNDSFDFFNCAKKYLKESRGEISDLVDPKDYNSDKEGLLTKLGDNSMNRIMENKFKEFEFNYSIAKGYSDTALKDIKFLSEINYSNSLNINEMQAMLLAKSITKAAKKASLDENNYGCGFAAEKPKPINIKVTKFTGDQYKQLILTELEKKEEQFAKLPLSIQAINEEQINEYNQRIKDIINDINDMPLNTLYSVPEEHAIEITINPGSDLDRMYALFTDFLLRNKEVIRISPTIRDRYNTLKNRTLVSAPSLLLDHGLYENLKEEIPQLGIYENPEAFRKLLETSKEKGGVDAIYKQITGKKASKLDHIDNFFQNIGNKIGLPNQFIDGK